jgi:hypothetical protein
MCLQRNNRSRPSPNRLQAVWSWTPCRAARSFSRTHIFEHGVVAGDYADGGQERRQPDLDDQPGREGRVVENVVAVPTPRAVGMTMSAIIGVSVLLPSLQAVSEALVACAEVRYIGVATGRYDIIVEAFFNDEAHLLEFVSTKLGALQGVTGAETNLILKVAKFSYEWEIP